MADLHIQSRAGSVVVRSQRPRAIARLHVALIITLTLAAFTMSAAAKTNADDDVDPCAQLTQTPKSAYALYLPRHDRELSIYLPAAWRASIAGGAGGLEDVLGMLIDPDDFTVELFSEDAEVDFQRFLLLSFTALPHPDTVGHYQLDRSAQSFVEGPFGLFRTEGLVEEQPYVEYRDAPTEASSMNILCRPWLQDEVHPCHMTLPGDEFDTTIQFHPSELPNWKRHRDRAIRFHNCATNPA